MNGRGKALPAVAVVLAACASPGPVAPGGDKEVLLDTSVSAVDERANLIAKGKQVAGDVLAGLQPGHRLTVYAFNSYPGTACEPLVFNFADASSGAEQVQMEAMQAALPGAIDAYVECVTGKEYGNAGRGGSEIFGSIPQALLAAQNDLYPVGELRISTDGCSVGEGLRTCSRRNTRPGFAKHFVNRLPAAAKPSLVGVDVVVAGLGVGTNLDAAGIAALRQIWLEYAAATGAHSIRFE